MQDQILKYAKNYTVRFLFEKSMFFGGPLRASYCIYICIYVYVCMCVCVCVCVSASEGKCMGLCMYQEIEKFSKSQNRDEICRPESYVWMCPIEFLFPALRWSWTWQINKQNDWLRKYVCVCVWSWWLPASSFLRTVKDG